MTAATTPDVYPSRIEDNPEVLPRRDPVIYGERHLTAEEALSENQIDQYEQDGVLVLPNFISSQEVDAILDQVGELRKDPQVCDRPEAVIEPESDSMRSLFAVHQIDPFFANIAADARFSTIARQLLGSDVYVHQSRINLKPGFAGKEFFWHSDFETWHTEDGMPRMRAVSFSLLLTPNYEYNGPLLVIPGSHQTYITTVGETPADHYRTSLKRQEIGVPDKETLTRLAEEGGITSCTGPAGTLVIFECNTLHGSAGNISPFPRSNLFMVYNSVENLVGDPYCGKPPRPEFIAHRGHVDPINPQGRFC